MNEQQKPSYVDAIRSKLQNNAESALTKKANLNEFCPEAGVHTIRILPPIDPNDLFYYTPSYHWIPKDLNEKPEKNGSYLWTRKSYMVNGIKKFDPIDEIVKEMYFEAREKNDSDLKKMAGLLKRKRNFICNVILYPQQGPPQFKVLVDRTNHGKLFRKICSVMGIPFWNDVDDNWVDAESTKIDPDKQYYDLLDMDLGHDFKINKIKFGINAWDISFDESFVIQKPRALTAEDRELLSQRVDLKTWVTPEENYDVVKNELVRLFPEAFEESKAVEGLPSMVPPPASTGAPVVQNTITTGTPVAITQPATSVIPVDQKALDDMLNELD